jgi:tRNA uridine 5-carbamoylmethylation protein Kti12
MPQEKEKRELSREMVGNSMMAMYDEANTDRRWGRLEFFVEFKDGKAFLIEKCFREKQTIESFK